MRNRFAALIMISSAFAFGAASSFAAEGEAVKEGKKADYGRAAEGDAVKSGKKSEFGREADKAAAATTTK